MPLQDTSVKIPALKDSADSMLNTDHMAVTNLLMCVSDQYIVFCLKDQRDFKWASDSNCVT
jgi:hypothetical protein